MYFYSNSKRTEISQSLDRLMSCIMSKYMSLSGRLAFQEAVDVGQ